MTDLGRGFLDGDICEDFLESNTEPQNETVNSNPIFLQVKLFIFLPQSLSQKVQLYFPDTQ